MILEEIFNAAAFFVVPPAKSSVLRDPVDCIIQKSSPIHGHLENKEERTTVFYCRNM